VVCAAKKQDGNIINHCSGFARRVQSHIPQNTIILSILIGKQESSPEKFLDAYISAIAASDCDVFLQEDDCIFYSWEYAPQQYDNDAVNKLLSQAEEAIQLGEISQAQILIDKIRKICSVYKNVGCFMQAKRNIDGALRKYLGEDVPEGTGIKKAKQYFDGVSALISEFSHNADVSLKTREALKYLHKNLDCDISLEDIARVMQVSPVYAGQLFKKDMGVSFNKYLASARIEKSKVLLKSGKYKIYEISAMVGYSTVQYFSSIFKKATGVSPSDYC
jgi:YesN/AraC family two-component response regulator